MRTIQLNIRKVSIIFYWTKPPSSILPECFQFSHNQFGSTNSIEKNTKKLSFRIYLITSRPSKQATKLSYFLNHESFLFNLLKPSSSATDTKSSFYGLDIKYNNDHLAVAVCRTLEVISGTFNMHIFTTTPKKKITREESAAASCSLWIFDSNEHSNSKFFHSV